jgi:TadE-like protein
MVEFALVAPLFFLTLFGAINAGLLLFSVNAASHSAEVGMVTLADEGTLSGADTHAITNLRDAGLGVTSLAAIDEIDIYRVYECFGGLPSAQCSAQPDGTLVAESNSNTASYNIRCYVNGAAAGTSTRFDGTTCTTSTLWTPGMRTQAAGPNGKNLTNIGLTIRYHFSYIGLKYPQLPLSETRYFRLEPQSA